MTHPLKFGPYRRPIFIIGGKVYPCDKLEILTDPQIPFEDYMYGRYDKEAVRVEHAILSRGRRIVLKSDAPAVMLRKSGRQVFCLPS